MELQDLSYIHTPADFHNNYETIPERLQHIAKQYGDKEVYVFLHPDGKRDSISAKELYKKSLNLAYSLIKLGIKKGDIIATCLYNELDLLVCTFGAIFAGAIIHNLAIRNEDGCYLKKTLNKLDVRCLILNPGEDNKQLDVCMHFIETISASGSVKSISVPSLQILISTLLVQEKQLLQLNELTEEPYNEFELPRLDPESIAVLFSTSGSTGEPKFVPYSHHNVTLIGHFSKQLIGYETNGIMYTESRISWIGGFPFPLLHDGTKMVTKTKSFDNIAKHCDFTYDAIKNENCSVANLFPATVNGLLEKINTMSEPSDLKLKSIHIGGLPVASVIMNAIGTLSEMVTNLYGSTEMGICTFNPIKSKEEYVNCCVGRPASGVEVKVVDGDGFVVGREIVGNLRVRSPWMFPYYYNDERKTKEVLSPNRWLNTDDIGYITKDGKVVVQGRKSDIILQGTRVMFPAQIEAFIKTHPDVFDVIVIPVPDPVYFMLACACIIPDPGKTLTPDEVDQFYTKGAMPFAQEAFVKSKPGLFMIFETFPTVSTGKPDKVALKRHVLARLEKE